MEFAAAQDGLPESSGGGADKPHLASQATRQLLYDSVLSAALQSRAEGPYLPSNVDFVAANNGLPEGAEAVRKVVMAASYMVMGLGDVYLGAPCAVPVDPRRGPQLWKWRCGS